VARFGEPEALAPGHAVDEFDCGVESLNVWLTRHAAQAAAAGSARTFVVVDAQQGRVVGYHALTAASIDREEATARAARGMSRHPIPAALLARLAVDVSVQGRGIGAWLLRDAMLRTLSAAESVGIRVLLVHALDADARGFYERHGFEASPTDPLNLQMLMKDLRAAVDEASHRAS
jgi:GNAT superfamily N-acetyltransferase